MKKKRGWYLRNKEMSDPQWIHKKQQDWFAFKAAWQRFEWGSAYLPDGVFEAFWTIRRELDYMDEPIKAWQPEKPEWIRNKKPRRKSLAALDKKE